MLTAPSSGQDEADKKEEGKIGKKNSQYTLIHSFFHPLLHGKHCAGCCTRLDKEVKQMRGNRKTYRRGTGKGHLKTSTM